MKRNSTFLMVAGVLSLTVVAGIACNVIPFGIPGMWVWTYKPVNAPARLGFPLVGLALLLVTMALPVRRLLAQPVTRQTECCALGSLWLSTFLLTTGVALVHPWGFMHTAALVFSIGPNSYYYTALQHPDLLSLLNGFDRQMVALPLHAQTQSAGPIVLCWGLRHTFDHLPMLQDVADVLIYWSVGWNCQVAGAYWGRIIQLPLSEADVGAALMSGLFFMGIGSLVVFPIYFLGKWLHNARVGMGAAIGFALLPSFHLFNATVDQMYPFVTAIALCLVTLAVRNLHRAWIYIGATGLWLSLAIFMNLGLLTLVPLCIGYAALALAPVLRKEHPKEHPSVAARSLWRWLLAFTAGLSAPWWLLGVLCHYNLIAVFLTSNRLRDTLYAQLNRSYLWSVSGNMIEFLIGVGIPVALLFLWYAYRGASSLMRRPSSVVAAPLLWSFLLLLVALDLSGKARGEVARLWLFLMPCVVLIAAAQARKIMPESRLGLLFLIACQCLQLLAFPYFLRVHGF